MRGVSQSPLTSTSLPPTFLSLLFPSCGSPYLLVEVLQTSKLARAVSFPAGSLAYLLSDNLTDNLFYVWLLLQSVSLLRANAFCFHQSLIAGPYLPSKALQSRCVFYLLKREAELKA